MRRASGDRPTAGQVRTLDVIRASGTISRVELAARTGLTEATISTVVRRLLDQGLVVEIGHRESTGGKRRVLLALDPAAGYAVGIQLDGSTTTYVIGDLNGTIVARWRRPVLAPHSPLQAVRQIADEVLAMIHRIGMDPERLLGVGLAAPRHLAPQRQTAWSPAARPSWVDFPLADELQGALDGCPVLIGHDATAAAAAEHWTGSCGPESVFATLFMATGIGAGVMVRGSVHRGAHGFAGEIGHLSVDPLGPPCWCGARGCLEAVAGPRAVVASALEQAGRGTGGELGLSGDPDRVSQDFAVLARAAVRGHPGAVRLLTRSAGHLGVAARSLVNVLDLDTLVLTGPGFTVAGPLYAGVVAEQVAAALSDARAPVEVRLSANIADAAAVGAVALVLRSRLTPDPLPPLPSVVV